MCPIRFHRGVGSGLALVVFISVLLLMELYQSHPVLACVLGAVLAAVVLAVVVWRLWQLVREVCSLSNDPGTRVAPYKTFEVSPQEQPFNPAQTSVPTQEGDKDITSN